MRERDRDAVAALRSALAALENAEAVDGAVEDRLRGMRPSPAHGSAWERRKPNGGSCRMCRCRRSSGRRLPIAWPRRTSTTAPVIGAELTGCGGKRPCWPDNWRTTTPRAPTGLAALGYSCMRLSLQLEP